MRARFANQQNLFLWPPVDNTGRSQWHAMRKMETGALTIVELVVAEPNLSQSRQAA